MQHEPASHPYRDFELAGWEHAAGAYADTFERVTQLFADVLLDAVGLRAGDTILDNACGTGFVAAAAARRGAAAIGADFSAPMLEQASRLRIL